MKRKFIFMIGLFALASFMTSCSNKDIDESAANTANETIEISTVDWEAPETGQGSEDIPNADMETAEDDIGIIKKHEQATSTEKCDTFTQMVDRTLANGQGYANEKIGDTDALIVAAETFGGYEQDAAVEAEIFIYSSEGAPTYIGCVKSGGTANPIALKDNMIYTVGHHYAGKHTIKDGKLLTVAEVWEISDKLGNVTYRYSSDDGEDHSDTDSEKAKTIFDEIGNEYNEARIIGFDTVKKV